MKLKAYLRTIKGEDAKKAFAIRCGTTLNHLRAVAYGAKPCGEWLAINLERESAGGVKVEESCPDIDWATVRNGTAEVVPDPAPTGATDTGGGERAAP
jgi:hypothetical protein